MAAGRIISLAAFLGLPCAHLAFGQKGNGRAVRSLGRDAAGRFDGEFTGLGLVLGQSDMPALFFSLAAIDCYMSYRAGDENPRMLIGVGALIAASIYTKQTFLAAGAAITLSLIVRRPRRGILFAIFLAAFGAAVAGTLNALTGGAYWQNAVLANLNPFSMEKFAAQLQYFAPTAFGLVILAAAGLAARKGRSFFELYLLAAAGVFLLTAAKVGSDLTDQIATGRRAVRCAPGLPWRGWTTSRCCFKGARAGSLCCSCLCFSTSC